MCILAFCTRVSPRFQLVLIHNRDEYVGRPTASLQVDPESNILWCLDNSSDVSASSQGSWLGINVVSGAFAALTNCRRAPSTVPTMPFDAIRDRCVNRDGLIMFQPDASRGLLVRQYLTSHITPNKCPWETPVMDGYNLLTCSSLFHPDLNAIVRYSTNRYGLQHMQPCDDEVSHVVANSFLDNAREQKTAFLRRSFEQAMNTIKTDSTIDVTLLRDNVASLLCSQNGFEENDETTLSSTRPFLGLTQEQEHTLLSATSATASNALTGGWSVEKEKLLHRDVFVSSCGPRYRTRTQTVIVVESGEKSSDSPSSNIVHFWMRNSFSPDLHDPWDYHKLHGPSI